MIDHQTCALNQQSPMSAICYTALFSSILGLISMYAHSVQAKTACLTSKGSRRALIAAAATPVQCRHASTRATGPAAFEQRTKPGNRVQL